MSEVSQRNERSVQALFEAERQRDIGAWASLWAERGRHTFWLANPQEPIVGRELLIGTTAAKFRERPSYEIGLLTERLADPRQILARLRLTSSALGDAVVHIWCLFHFDDDGLIVENEEIVDTAPIAFADV